MTRTLMTALSLLVLVIATAGSVQAQEPAPADTVLGFGISPAHPSDEDPTSFGYFTHQLEPGDELVDEALVINEGDLPVRLKLYAAEATSAVNGGTAFGGQDDNPSGAASWLSFDVQEVSLEPGETQIVPFTITVPIDASPGDHVAGLLVETFPTGPESGTGDEPQFMVEVVQRVGVAVVIDIAGDRVAELEITDLGLGQQHEEGANFEVAVRVTGNVMVDGHGSLTITDGSGSELAEIPFEIDTIMAQASTFLNIDHPVLLADGGYLLHAEVAYCAVREDDTCGTTSLDNIELQVIDGQADPREDLDVGVSQPSTLRIVGDQDHDTNRSVTYLTAAAGALLALALSGVVWRRKRVTSPTGS